MRNGKPKTIKARIAAASETTESPAVKNVRLQGLTVGDIKEDHPLHGTVEGVIIVEIERGSRPWRSGLRAGDIITSVNKNPVANLQQFLKLAESEQGTLLLRIVRGNTAAFVVIK